MRQFQYVKRSLYRQYLRREKYKKNYLTLENSTARTNLAPIHGHFPVCAGLSDSMKDASIQ
jgi:hypothetical protein